MACDSISAKLLRVGETLDYPLDWTEWLAGDTIASASFSVPSGITKTSETNTTAISVVWLLGVGAGSFDIEAEITTAGGRTKKHVFRVLCRA